MTVSDDEFSARLRSAASLDALHSGLSAERVLASSRRARRRRTAGLSAVTAVVALAVVAVGAGWTGVDGGAEPVPAAAPLLGILPVAAVGHGCAEVPVPGLSDPDQVVPTDRWGSLAPVAGILHLVDDRTPEYAVVTSGPAVCDAVPVAVLHDEDGQRGVVVYRDVTEPFRGITDLDEATVLGHPADVLSPPAGHHYVSWTDDDGVRWFAEAAGLSVEELAETLTASLDDTGLATVPEGFESVPVPEHEPDGTVYRWAVQYEAGGYTYLEVTSPARAPVEARAAWPGEQQYTTVGDAAAVYLPDEQGGAGIRWNTAEASYRLVIAGADLTELRETAERLEPVTPDDPRLPVP
ncbi:hypothetical protein [Actinotalea subterranea]|uniref:hypothetical protein n=1 Tax=Actinotalea subterranea TaxID=2607497 RepID=UPI0011EF7E2A|nr:hypothetical protein [Actinotalea subterranea]